VTRVFNESLSERSHILLRRPPFFLLLIVVVLLNNGFVLSACQPAVEPSINNRENIPDGTNLPENLSTDGSINEENSSQTINSVTGLIQQPPNNNNQADEPARFLFPTQAPPPLSAWRPPLYPVPWALRDYDHFFFIRPIPVDDINWPLANYRYGGIFFEDVVHTGVDIPGPAGTPVLAAGAGKVIWSGYGLLTFTPDNYDDPYGLAIAIKHDFGYDDQPLYTLYAHLSESYVIRDQVVDVGETIGLTGETGAVTGPHLHFEIRIGRNDYYATRNPELWMSPPQGWGVLAGRVMDTAGELLERKEVIVTAVEDFKVWMVMTYGPKSVNSDPYYQENVAMGDLPAGDYKIDIQYGETKYSKIIQVVPGTVTYFTFQGEDGFFIDLPATPTVDPDMTSP
jgi:murein DD-endopeptidase MepM/ murein hydrolase activator NlpD